MTSSPSFVAGIVVGSVVVGALIVRVTRVLCLSVVILLSLRVVQIGGALLLARFLHFRRRRIAVSKADPTFHIQKRDQVFSIVLLCL